MINRLDEVYSTYSRRVRTLWFQPFQNNFRRFCVSNNRSFKETASVRKPVAAKLSANILKEQHTYSLSVSYFPNERHGSFEKSLIWQAILGTSRFFHVVSMRCIPADGIDDITAPRVTRCWGCTVWGRPCNDSQNVFQTAFEDDSKFGDSFYHGTIFGDVPKFRQPAPVLGCLAFPTAATVLSSISLDEACVEGSKSLPKLFRIRPVHTDENLSVVKGVHGRNLTVGPRRQSFVNVFESTNWLSIGSAMQKPY